MAVVHRAVRGTRLRDWRLQPLPGNEGTLLAVQAVGQILGWREVATHRIHGTGIFTYMNGWFFLWKI